jgi:hypothetical protein
MTSNEINWLLFSLLVLAVLVQASSALVMLSTSCDKRPPGRESFRKALAIAVAAIAAGAILYGVLGVPNWDNRFRRPAAGTAGDALVDLHPTRGLNTIVNCDYAGVQ